MRAWNLNKSSAELEGERSCQDGNEVASVGGSVSGARKDCFTCYDHTGLTTSKILKFHRKSSQARMVREFGNGKMIEAPCLKR